MAAGPLSLESIIAQALGTGVGFGIGLALGEALEPEAVGLAQDAWQENTLRSLGAGPAAEIVAQAILAADWGHGEARNSGIDSERFNALVESVVAAPAFSQLVEMARRDTVADADFDHGLAKHKIDERYRDGLRQLQVAPIDPGAIATAIHRGIMAGQGLLLVEPPDTAGAVPHVKQSDLDGVTEAAWHGLSRERLRVLVANTGLPLALGEMLHLLNMGKVTDDDVRRSVAYSNVRNEYMEVALNLRRRLLTPREYAEAELRGVLATDAARAGAGLSGLEAADYGTLFETVGRPLNVHAITTGLARGGTFGGTYADVPEPYQDAIRRSAIRPEYAVLAYANRYTYPSAFVIRSMAQAGELGDEQAVERVLLEIGWSPAFAAKVAKAWAPTGPAADKHVAKAQTQLWTAAHKAYVDDRMTDAAAEPALAAAGVEVSAVADVLALWRDERAIIRSGLSPAEIKKAVGTPGHDAAWAIERLGELGWTADDASTYLES